MLLVMIWCSASIFETVSQTVETKFLWTIFSYFGSQPFTGVVLLFALRYTGRGNKLTRNKVVALFAFPTLIIILAITNPWHRLIWPNIYLKEVPGGIVGVFEHGLFFWLLIAYSYVIAGWAIMILSAHFFFSRNPEVTRQSKVLFFAALCPLSASILYAFAPDSIGGYDPTPLSFTLMNAFLILSSFRLRFLDLVPVAWENVIDTLDDGILAIDQQQRIVGWNPVLEKWFGLQPDQRGMAYDKALSEWPQLIRVIARTENESAEIELVPQDKTDRTIEVRLIPFCDHRGKNMGKIVTFQDITDKKTAQKKLVDALDQAESANKAKSAFLSAVSHEIRNPLQGMSGVVFLLAKTHLSFDQKGYMERIQSALGTLSEILNNILDLSKIEAGKISLESVDFNLRMIAQDVYYLFDSLAEEKGLTIDLNIEGSLPAACRGDPLRVKQILINLVSNAVKFTPSGGRITVRAWGEPKTSEENEKRSGWKGQTVFFQVKDTGMGLSDEKLKHLFNAFYQGDPAVARRYGGTGLGLSIAKALTELMGGQISVESRLGVGTAFTFSLRLDPASALLQTEEKTSEPVSLVKGKRVLYIEDNAVNRMVLTEILTSFGLSVTAVSDGKTALEESKKNVFDLMITDIFLPDMEGYELARMLRGIAAKMWPVIALTGSGTREAQEKAQKAGIDTFLIKPVSPNRLLDEINRLLGGETAQHASNLSSPKREPDALFQKLPAIDHQSALELVGNDLEIYREALNLFVVSIRNLEKSFRDSLGHGRFEEARGDIHRAKGAAWVIGAKDFAETCAALETTFEEQMPKSLEPLLIPWINELKRLLDSREIRDFIQEGSP